MKKLNDFINWMSGAFSAAVIVGLLAFYVMPSNTGYTATDRQSMDEKVYSVTKKNEALVAAIKAPVWVVAECDFEGCPQ